MQSKACCGATLLCSADWVNECYANEEPAANEMTRRTLKCGPWADGWLPSDRVAV